MDFDFEKLANKILNISRGSRRASERRELCMQLIDSIFIGVNKAYTINKDGERAKQKKHLYNIYVEYCRTELTKAVEDLLSEENNVSW